MTTNSFHAAGSTRVPAGTKSALTVLALAGALVLSGCTAEPEPAPAAPSTAAPVPVVTASPEPAEPEETPTPEPAEEPTPPDPSQLINENTEEGAKSAVQYFFDLRQYTYEARDDQLWISRTTDECEFCATTSRKVSELLAENRTREGGTTNVESYNFAEERWTNVWVVQLTVSESSQIIRSSAGEIVTELEGSTDQIQMYLDFVTGTWILEEVTE